MTPQDIRFLKSLRIATDEIGMKSPRHNPLCFAAHSLPVLRPWRCDCCQRPNSRTDAVPIAETAVPIIVNTVKPHKGPQLPKV